MGKRTHVPDFEGDIWVALSCFLDHARRDVDASHICTSLTEVVGHMARAATEITDRSVDAARDLIEQPPIEGLSFELGAEVGGVGDGERVVTRFNLPDR